MVRTLLLPVVPLAGNFPDFLTPAPVADLEHGIDLVLATRPARRRDELGRLAPASGAGAWLADLAADRGHAVQKLGEAMRRYFRTAIAPYWTEIGSSVAGNRAMRAVRVLHGGVGQILDDLGPRVRWCPPELSVHGYPVDRRLHLEGRGITLIPAYFCWRDPIALADPGLPPVLVYPARRPAPAPPVPRARRLGPLIGHSRLAVLLATAPGATTSEIARRVGISLGTASHHASILRDAGLIGSQRYGNLMLHRPTPLGEALLADAAADV